MFKPAVRRGPTGAGICRIWTAVHHRPHATPQKRKDPAVRKNASAPAPPWAFAVAGLLASLSIGLAAAVASYLAGLIVPESAAAQMVPWAVYLVAEAALTVSRIAVAGDQKRRLPWPWAYCPAWRFSPPTTGRSDNTKPVRARGIGSHRCPVRVRSGRVLCAPSFPSRSGKSRYARALAEALFLFVFVGRLQSLNDVRGYQG